MDDLAVELLLPSKYEMYIMLRDDINDPILCWRKYIYHA